MQTAQDVLPDHDQQAHSYDDQAKAKVKVNDQVRVKVVDQVVICDNKVAAAEAKEGLTDDYGRLRKRRRSLTSRLLSKSFKTM